MKPLNLVNLAAAAVAAAALLVIGHTQTEKPPQQPGPIGRYQLQVGSRPVAAP